MNIYVKILIAILAIVVISKYIAPLLTGFFPPFGVIILILLFIGVVLWLMDWNPLKLR